MAGVRAAVGSNPFSAAGPPAAGDDPALAHDMEGRHLPVLGQGPFLPGMDRQHRRLRMAPVPVPDRACRSSAPGAGDNHRACRAKTGPSSGSAAMSRAASAEKWQPAVTRTCSGSRSIASRTSAVPAASIRHALGAPVSGGNASTKRTWASRGGPGRAPARRCASASASRRSYRSRPAAGRTSRCCAAPGGQSFAVADARRA